MGISCKVLLLVFLTALTGCTVVFYGSVGSRKTFDVQTPTWGMSYDSDATTSTVHALDTVGEAIENYGP